MVTLRVITMFFDEKAEKALNLVESINKADTDRGYKQARDGARAYMHQVADAINVLSEYEAKRADSIDDLRAARDAMKVSGQPACMVTLANGCAGLFGADGKLVFSYIHGATKEGADHDN